MCYAALAASDYRRLQREFNAKTDIRQFELLFRERVEYPARNLKIPAAIDRHFMEGDGADEAGIRATIEAYRAAVVPEWERAIFVQRQRHAKAGCVRETEGTALHTVSEYQSDPELRKEQTKRCAGNPEALGSTADCRNVRAAERLEGIGPTDGRMPLSPMDPTRPPP